MLFSAAPYEFEHIKDTAKEASCEDLSIDGKQLL